MKEKLDFSKNLKIRQDLWQDAPCSSCFETHCCRNLPLAPLRVDSRRDFINLMLTSCYNEILTVLKKTGEWTFYLKRDCSFLNKSNGQCLIHKEDHQSKICKSYDAHNCWYVDAFKKEKFTTMIKFNTEMIIWFEKRYKLIENKFDVDIDWEELCQAAHDYRKNIIDINPGSFAPLTSMKLSFSKSRSDQFLFMPPYNLPENRNHFEILSFRLGFPGIYLAITDNCWAFVISTEIIQARLALIKQEYYPAINHKDGSFSFDNLKNERNPYSATGDQWIILQRSDLQILIDLTIFDDGGKVRKIPSSSDILKALKSRSPNRAA